MPASTIAASLYAQEDEGDEQYSEHAGRKFCYDSTCPDKEDQEAVNEVNGWVQDGLVSIDDANNIYHGRTV